MVQPDNKLVLSAVSLLLAPLLPAPCLRQAVPGEPLGWSLDQDPFRGGTRQSSLAQSALLSWAVLSLRVQEGQSRSSGNGFACAIGGTMPR